MCSLCYQYLILVCFCLDHALACLVRVMQHWEMVLSYFREGSRYDNLVVGMYVLMQFWSSLVQQEGSEDDAWLGLG